ncbi:MAG TPA: AAA family ATPase [Acidimicrobiales bacterium]|nr:AAA family ATPase [Acidimicrobiales bacterium]
MTIVGRTAELERVARGIAMARRGEGGTVCVVGPPGIGKSTLSREVASTADVVLTGRCAPPPAAPLRPVAELALSALAAGASLERVDGTVFGAGVRLLLGERIERPDASRHALLVAEGLRLLLGELNCPVLCVVEDLHWADDETRGVLDYLVDHLDDFPVLVVANARPHESGAVDDLLHDWQRRGVAEILHLARFDRDEVADLVRSVVDRPDETQIDAILAASEGTPLLVAAFAEEVKAGRTELSMPSNYRDAVARRFHDLEEPDRRAIAVAAVVGRQIDLQLLRRFGLDVDAGSRAVRAAVQAQLVHPATGDGAARFRHALTRDAVVDAIDPATRVDVATAALDGVVIDALDDDGLDAASQLAAATGNERRAGELLLEAARRAVDVGATMTALARIEQARALEDVDAVRGPEVRELQVHALAQSGRATEAIEIGEELLSTLDDRPDRARKLTVALARADGSRGEWDSARERLDAAAVVDPDVPAGFRSFRAVVAMELGEVERAAALARPVLDEPSAGAVARCEAREVLGRVARERSYAESAEHFRAAIDIAGEAGLELWRARSLFELGLCDATLHGRSDTLAEASLRARRLGGLGLSVMCDYNLANLYGIQVRPAEALDAADRAITTASHVGAGVLEALGWVAAGQAHAATGARGKARYAGDRARDSAAGEPEIDGMAIGMCEAWPLTVAGDLAAAADAFARSLALLDALPYPTATAPWYAGPVVLAGAAHPLVPQIRARLGTASFAAVPGLEIMTAMVDLILAGRSGGPDAVAAHAVVLDQSIRRHPELVARVEPFIAIARGVVAVAGHTDGWGDPAADLAGAEECCRLRGLKVPARWLANALRTVGGPARTRGRSAADIPDALDLYNLTRREYDVLELLRHRLTNREIADRLTVSPSTVKTHIERLLAKTGRSNRTELSELIVAVLG